MKRKPIPKQKRLDVYNKYNGHCAYCGCELEYKDMQVDHIESVYVSELFNRNINNDISNLMPTCRMCNFYKSTGDIEYLRRQLENVLMRNVRRPFDYRLALKYGFVSEHIKPVKFYFEEYDK